MSISKTKMLINNKNGYLFSYKDYDENGNITDKGFHFYNEFSDDLVVSSNDDVYIDSVGTYTKDSDGNKVYHNMEVNTNNNFTFIHTDGTNLNSYNDMNISIDLNSTSLDLTLDDNNFPNGIYEDDNDNYYLKLDLVDSKTLTFKSKADGYKLVNFSIPYTRELFNLFNNDFSYSNILESIDLNNIKEPYKINHINNKFNDVNNNISNNSSTIETSINSNFKTTNNSINNINTLVNTTNTNINTSKDNIINEIDTKYDDLNNNVNDINKNFNDLKISFISLNGSSGAKYKDNSIVTIKNYNGNWKIICSIIYKSERGILNIAYQLIGLDDVNENDNMIISEDLINSYIEPFVGSKYDTSTTDNTSSSDDSSTTE